MKLFIILAVSILAFAFIANAEEKKEEEKKESKKAVPHEAGAEEIKKAMDGFIKFYLIDTRKEKAYKSEHLIGAFNLPVADFSKEALHRLAPDKKQRILFYCEDEECDSAGLEAAKAMELGYERVYKYRTGFKDWENRGYPTQQ